MHLCFLKQYSINNLEIISWVYVSKMKKKKTNKNDLDILYFFQIYRPYNPELQE